MAYKILIVDDEPDLREILQCNLENAGYEVDTAESAEEALHLLSSEHHLILLDVMLGGMSGFKMAEKLRKELKNQTPIIFLTAKDTENDMLTGFSAGGDDYIAKPFSLNEVLARIKAILRRTQTAPENPVLKVAGLTIDYTKKLVESNGKEVRLSPKEFGILSMLAKQPGRVFSREKFWLRCGMATAMCLTARSMCTLRVFAANSKKKCLPPTNRRGYGYCFEE